jgi:DNA-binding NarL/FixJ family response regulator
VIRVVIVDDQQLVRDGFAAILTAEEDVEVVGLAADGLEALRVCRETAPDVVLMDVRMPNLDGVEATRRLLGGRGSMRVLMLTTFDLDRHVYDALHAGASGFLLKDAPGGGLAAAVRAVAAGETLLDPVVTRRLLERFVRRPPPSLGVPTQLESLSGREVQVMHEVARGLSNHEIAKRLYLSDATVKTHVANILRKLDLRDRVQLVVAAYETGLVEPGSSDPSPDSPAPSS